MESPAFDVQLLHEIARYQVWADAAHWKALHENAALLEDPEIQTRLNHMIAAMRMLTALSRGESPDPAGFQQTVPADQLETAQQEANAGVMAALGTVDLQKMIALPRGPKGPWEAPAGVLLLQALTHSQHHRGQNASRMRQLGAKPPMTDYVLWYAFGRP